jgi:sec-independent protein translocase protein TatA|tara:strand:- start:578 stop:718 length:141 start_codon:yes stop_codon:yes gene_type:complete
MFGRFGELLLILLIVFVLFGAGKLPKVMSELGKGLRSFKKSLEEED